MDYETVLFFFYLSSVQLAKQRVALRVSKGGHNIPEGVIERRYLLGIKTFLNSLQLLISGSFMKTLLHHRK